MSSCSLVTNVTHARNENYTALIYGSKEDLRTFLSKPKIAKTIEYLKKGYKASEISRIVGIHVNTITKVKKMVG